MIITLDGPAGSGKSTAARQLAKALGVAYLDTGATYRAVTLAALRAGVNLEDESALAELAAAQTISLQYQGDRLVVLLNGEDVSREIRTARITDNAHYIARAASVRALLVQMQRRIGHELDSSAGGVVSEGRDQGSVVFPDARFKFYLDAAPHVRARRRHAEMTADGQQVAYQEVLDGILRRDGRDLSRAVAPLVRPDGAIAIDTSDQSIEQVTAGLIRHVKGL